ncbi:MAG TPA: UDP-N-acetylmuramoyl-L-alanine--D-glutamate ligase [Candidatus Paceibacterota bacterium]|jgi:UDP-N-acetylmuramoylalanine--D-glutamate ligase|nr:UDP-N-acetylmuramoyl-L-alanine--D-glutamate ligase [Candidatus Paceibacterota bacterium]
MPNSANSAADFKGKKITLMGLGLLGRGVGDAEFFAEAGADLTVTDLKSEAELAPSLARLKKFKNITYHLGGHRLEDFENRDLIIRAPNAPLDSPFIARAREKKIPIEMDASLFAKLSRATVVGITGTRGKSTVTHLIYQILKAAGKNPLLGGNERDVATLSLTPRARPGDLAVLELDSWQLQGFEEGAISPHVAVWTNFMPDHMNYYKNDMDRYFRDKAAIARFQKKGDYLITTPEIKGRLEAKFGALAGTCATDVALPEEWRVILPGEHNRKNAAYAYEATRALGIPDETIKKVLATWTGLPGRLELLGEKNGAGNARITFYDDGNATTPEATIAALRTLTPQKCPIILIGGGSDKELNFSDLAPEIERSVKVAILFKGAATDKLKQLFDKKFPVEVASTMDEAFAKAFAAASALQKSIILLSPAATSFGIFKNEYDRSDQFKALVKKELAQ